MVGLRNFIAIWLVVAVAVSAFVMTAPTLTHPKQADEMSNHFSVAWKGFQPSYNNQTPDYYISINNLPDDVLTMNIAMQIQNFENSSYWFLIEQYTTPPAGWTVNTYYIGYIGIDVTKTFTYSNISRSKPMSIPEGRITESVDLVVKAYSDPSYLDFYSEANFTVSFHLIDLTSPTWTTLYYDNFDDGTTQGWSHGYRIHDANRFYADPYVQYRSWPYSLRLGYSDGSTPYGDLAFFKIFDTTGPYTETYLVFAIRSSAWSGVQVETGIELNGTTYFRPDSPLSTDTWYQFVIPLPLSQTIQFAIWAVGKGYGGPGEEAYLDDVYVIAK